MPLRKTSRAIIRALLHRYPLPRGHSQIARRLRGVASGHPIVAGPEGTLVKLDLSQVPSQHWFWFGVWEAADMVALRRFVRAGATVLDVGANIGLFTLAMARLVGAEGVVHAFEPDPRNHVLLSENVTLNGFGGRVVLNGVALGDATGMAFFEPSGDAASSHITTTGSAVEVLRLDEYPIDELDFMKIDVEGAECSVLRGGEETIRRCRPVMLVECAERHLARAGSSLDELAALLRAADYRPFDNRGRELSRLPANANVVCIPRA